MSANPYRLPQDGLNRIVNFSGGRSSAYMLFQILAAHRGSIPANCHVVFCNTGQEHEATLGFVDRWAREWNVDIDWLEYRYRPEARGGRHDPKSVHVHVDHATASRDGEPFDALIRKADILPNAVTRKCTAELKVAMIERYVRRDLGWKLPDVRNVIGLRYDERSRWEDALTTECRTEYPMVHARVTHRDIAAFWARHPFDLAIHSALGNCDACFMKGRQKLVPILRDNPEIADWWIDAEEQAVARRKDVLRKPEMARFYAGSAGTTANSPGRTGPGWRGDRAAGAELPAREEHDRQGAGVPDRLPRGLAGSRRGGRPRARAGSIGPCRPNSEGDGNDGRNRLSEHAAGGPDTWPVGEDTGALPGEGERAGVPEARRPGALPAQEPGRLGDRAAARLDHGRRDRTHGSGPMRGRARKIHAIGLALVAADALLAVPEVALATTDTTFGDPLDTVQDVIGGTCGQLAAALAVGAPLVGSVLRGPPVGATSRIFQCRR